MPHRFNEIVRVCFLLIAVSASGQAVPQAKQLGRGDLTVMEVDVILQCSIPRIRPRNEAEWATLLSSKGFRRKDPSSPWSATGPAGELRALSVFGEKSSSYWIIFFPASSEAVPDALLAYWLKDARKTTLTLDEIEIVLGGTESLEGGGIKAHSVSISAGGHLLAVRTQIDWNEK